MRVITWNRSFRGLANNDDLNDDFNSEEQETHATVLDKLLAWEKKLYDEVKVQFRIFFFSSYDAFLIKLLILYVKISSFCVTFANLVKLLSALHCPTPY